MSQLDENPFVRLIYDNPDIKILYNTYRHIGKSEKLEQLEENWKIMNFIKSNKSMPSLPLCLKNIIANYVNDTWEPKSSKTNNSKSFLTKTINQKIVNWAEHNSVFCKICNMTVLDCVMIKADRNDEFIMTDICVLCLKFTTLDNIGLTNYKPILWTKPLQGAGWRAVFDNHLIILKGANLSIIKN